MKKNKMKAKKGVVWTVIFGIFIGLATLVFIIIFAKYVLHIGSGANLEAEQMCFNEGRLSKYKDGAFSACTECPPTKLCSIYMSKPSCETNPCGVPEECKWENKQCIPVKTT